MAPVRGVAEPLRAKFSVRGPPLANRGLGMASLEKWYTGPLEQTASQALHILHLMHEERFQPLPLTFIYFKQKSGLRLDQMAPEKCDGLFGD
jgi:hypothetical protein